MNDRYTLRPSQPERTDDPARHETKLNQLALGMPRLLGYMAGPIGADPMVARNHALHALTLAKQLTDLYGVEFITPQASVLVEELEPRSTAEWLRLDGALLSRCDFVYRIEGYSPGAAAEEDLALRMAIPVMHSADELREWLTDAAVAGSATIRGER